VSRKKNVPGKFPGNAKPNEELADMGRGLLILAFLIAEKHLQKLGKAETLRPEKRLKEH
jgi:hypothetical protein